MLKWLPALVAAFALAGSSPVAFAKPIKTTSCEKKTNQTIKNGGKTYTGCSCDVCKTTTCQTNGPANCTVETSRTCDCPQTAERGKGGTKTPRKGVLMQ